MLDLAQYERVRLRRKPWLQRLIADGFLHYDYRKVAIEIDREPPDYPVIFAMNHTDNFNYWPFQYSLHRRARRYTATWVKGKNYEHPAVAAFMRMSNNIPVASRGYLIARDFMQVVKRRPHPEEYRALRAVVDNRREITAADAPFSLLRQPRNLFGYRFNPQRESYGDAITAVYRTMMTRFVELNRTALSIGLDLLVFPQGSRSIRLSQGHNGLAQIALHLGATVVPVGCSGSNHVYPGASFFARPGSVRYRMGVPIRPDDVADIAPAEAFEPFSSAAERLHRRSFDAVVQRIMHRINELLDEEYRFSDDQASGGSRDIDRFV